MEPQSTIKTVEVINIIALLLSPVIAVCIGFWLQERKKIYEVKKNIFLTLIAHRGDQVHHNFVNSLNMIDFVFRKDKAVITAWHTHRDNLKQDRHCTPDEIRRSLLNLLAEMTDCLGYKKLRQTSFEEHYVPNAHYNQAVFDIVLRDNLVGYLKSGKEVFEFLKKEADKKANQSTSVPTDSPMPDT